MQSVVFFMLPKLTCQGAGMKFEIWDVIEQNESELKLNENRVFHSILHFQSFIENPENECLVQVI